MRLIEVIGNPVPASDSALHGRHLKASARLVGYCLDHDVLKVVELSRRRESIYHTASILSVQELLEYVKEHMLDSIQQFKYPEAFTQEPSFIFSRPRIVPALGHSFDYTRG